MTDYGHPITFGLSLDPAADRLPETRRLARAAQEHGLEYLAVQDHPYQPGHLDAWTLISHLAAGSAHITFLTDVADLQLRPPTMLAKAAASLAVLTGGRVTLGVGGGASTDAIAAMGGARRSRRDMVAYTAEALQVMRAALAGRGVRLDSRQHAIEGYTAGPLPPGAVPLWLGSQMPRMLAVTGALSDGWISPLDIYVPPAEVPARQKIIDEAAVAAGREPSDVRRVYNVLGPHADAPRLTEWALELGFDTFILWPTESPERELARFAAEVVPAVRASVEAGR